MRKIRWSRLFILVGSLFIGLGLFITATSWILGMVQAESETSTTPTVTYSTFTMKLQDYVVYKLDDVDFNFVLVDFLLGDSSSISYSYSSLCTDEATVDVSDYKDYIDTLELAGYYVSTMGVDYTLSSDKTEDTFTIFIPVADKDKEELTIYDAISKSSFTIDLNTNVGRASDLRYTSESEDTTITTSDYSITVSSAYIETSLITSSGEQYSYPSTYQIYTFILEIEDLNDETLVLEDAIFIPDGSSEEIHALDASVSSTKINNFISQTISQGDRGALFFEMYSPYDASITYSGTLSLKFSNSDEWITIETEMN